VISRENLETRLYVREERREEREREREREKGEFAMCCL
jgi:hypothetical protein